LTCRSGIGLTRLPSHAGRIFGRTTTLNAGA
jgi:hypothetical protein